MMMLRKLLANALRHAAQDADDELSPVFHPALAQRVQHVKAVVDFLFGIVAHRTGVQEHRIGIVDGVASLIACHLHDRCNHFRVGHIHLTAISFYVKFLHVLICKVQR